MIRRRRAPSKLTITIIAGIVLALAVGLIIWRGVSQAEADKAAASSVPTFQAILPKDTTIETLGGWEKLTPPSGEPVYVFADKIGDVGVTVSQQQLPDAFRNDSDNKVAALAKAYNAAGAFDIDGTAIYIGTSAKGPQSVIFRRGTLLILIKSQAKVSNEAWITYIRSLE